MLALILALTELVNANVKWLDTINKSLSQEVKKSFYGKKLDQFVVDVKKSEIKNSF